MLLAENVDVDFAAIKNNPHNENRYVTDELVRSLHLVVLNLA